LKIKKELASNSRKLKTKRRTVSEKNEIRSKSAELDLQLKTINSSIEEKMDQLKINKKHSGNFKITEFGGYLNNVLDRNSFVHESLKNSGVIRLENCKIIDHINYFQKIPFKINLKILTYILHSIVNNKYIGEDIHFQVHKESSLLPKYIADFNFEKVQEI
jgi:hypothetical protein